MVRGSLPGIAVTMASGREIYGAFSLIVDDVDSHSMSSENSDLDGLSNVSSSHNSSSQTPLDSPGGPREKIKQMQVEAETRRGEFARLLEEHAQVVRKLKMMEAEEQLSASGNVVGATHA
ncbi:uncharacterized protein LOC100882677 isoform X1 [Megachile rotundata]|uniref:uncharacterized protein LOC100882677 isoform X1 n=2 Tax=Megachile rotundata TaxID=143995 RepID=UPI000258EF03|nr:PREDICTED: uncharacterized protein LOC100882677 isoform X1 [Megachile rotundata]